MDLNEENDGSPRNLEDVKFPLLEFEKQIFIDVFEKDSLLIMAKYVLSKVS